MKKNYSLAFKLRLSLNKRPGMVVQSIFNE